MAIRPETRIAAEQHEQKHHRTQERSDRAHELPVARSERPHQHQRQQQNQRQAGALASEALAPGHPPVNVRKAMPAKNAGTVSQLGIRRVRKSTQAATSVTPIATIQIAC